MEQGGGRGWWPLGDSCAVVMRDVTIGVNRRQRICLRIDSSNETRFGGCSNEPEGENVSNFIRIA